MRRSADALKKPTYVEDKDSGELRRPHHLDLKTGMYKGRQVLKVKKNLDQAGYFWIADALQVATIVARIAPTSEVSRFPVAKRMPRRR